MINNSSKFNYDYSFSNLIKYYGQTDKMFDLTIKIYYLLEHFPKKGLTVTEISNLLKIKYEDVYYALQYLLVRDGKVIKDDFWDKESKYFFLDEAHEKSAYSVGYYKLNDIDKVKSFSLISDTHIGNKSMEDMILINNIYDYFVKVGNKICYHMGDLFEGSKELDPKVIESQLSNFIKYYPKLNEIKTYGIIGNHDEFVNSYLKSNSYRRSSDLRWLSLFNSSFYMFPRNMIVTNICNRKIHFSHKLYISWMENNCRIKTIDDLLMEDIDMFLDCKNDFLISGHLHEGFIYSKRYSNGGVIGKEHIYIGVPSTSKYNIGKSVGCIVRPFYDRNTLSHIELDVLCADSNRKISVKETIEYSFNHNDKVYKKII